LAREDAGADAHQARKGSGIARLHGPGEPLPMAREGAVKIDCPSRSALFSVFEQAAMSPWKHAFYVEIIFSVLWMICYCMEPHGISRKRLLLISGLTAGAALILWCV
jgi:hypothetical protein